MARTNEKKFLVNARVVDLTTYIMGIPPDDTHRLSKIQIQINKYKYEKVQIQMKMKFSVNARVVDLTTHIMGVP